MNAKKFYITTPIYYPSNKLHIGHLYTTTWAWVLSNYKKLVGFNVLLMTGSDEHGQKIAKKAKELKLDPQTYVDKMALKFQNLWKDFMIDYDFFTRTSNSNHQEVVKKVFDKLKDQKDIYLDTYKGLYSIEDEEFLTTSQAFFENNKYYHPQSKHELVILEEKSYFLKVSQYQKWWESTFNQKQKIISPVKIYHEVLNNFVKQNLQDLSITRQKVSWAIKLDDKTSIYVWFDALLSYLSTLGYLQKENHNFLNYWQKGNEIVHVIGKEISRFHTIYWPIILKALNLRLPTKIIAHGWLLLNDAKISKSKGNIVDPYYLLKTYDPEAIKYFFISKYDYRHDGKFDDQELKSVFNSNLVNNWANLINRSLKLINHHFPQKLSSFNFKNLKNPFLDLIKTIEKYLSDYLSYFDDYKLNHGLECAFNLSHDLNRFLEVVKPWTLNAKDLDLNNFAHLVLNGIYAIATMLQVVMPQKIKEVGKMLNIEKFDLKEIKNWNKFSNHKLGEPKHLFERLR